MDCLTNKIVKKTNSIQFRTLVDSMDEFPELATSSPIFGKIKAEVETKWDIVAQRVNAVGPPVRNAADWKKIWADIKCRTKGKIAENNKNMNGTGGGPSSIIRLTAIETDIDRICHLSAAAAPTGNTFGVSLGKPTTKKPIILEATPPRRTNNVAVVTPETSGQSQAHFQTILSPIQSTPKPNYQTTATPNSSMPLTTNYTKSLPTQTSTQRKRKCAESNVQEAEQIKLLKLQLEHNSALVDEMRAQTRNLNSMADSLRGIENAMKEIISFSKDE